MCYTCAPPHFHVDSTFIAMTRIAMATPLRLWPIMSMAVQMDESLKEAESLFELTDVFTSHVRTVLIRRLTQNIKCSVEPSLSNQLMAMN